MIRAFEFNYYPLLMDACKQRGILGQRYVQTSFQ